MKTKSKNLSISIICVMCFGAYFILSLACASTGEARKAGVEVSVLPDRTEASRENYDITLVSEEKSPSRILKIVSKLDGKIYYTISAPGDTVIIRRIPSQSGMAQEQTVDYNLVTSSEINEKFFISEEDAKNTVQFINEIEQSFRDKREGGGTLKKFEIFKLNSETASVWNKQKRIEKSTAYGAFTLTESGELQNVKYDSRERIFFIQHSTAYGEDEILYSANGSDAVVVKLEEILAVRDALAK